MSFNHGESQAYDLNVFQLEKRWNHNIEIPRKTLNVVQFNVRVSVTIDLWYMCVIAHWMNYNFSIQKIIIAFELMFEKCNSQNHII